MNINTISAVHPDPEDFVSLKVCGNILEIRYMAAHPVIQIKKIGKDQYVNLQTGEVVTFRHKTNRAEDKASVAQSLKRLRDIINTNVTNSENALWVTLTYAENMTDPKRLYEDYRRFWQRFKHYLDKADLSAEYITAAEPQGRGAWHLHCIFIFPQKAPFVPNGEMARLWGHGFTKTKSLTGVDNPGLYLTAYLGDMELSEAIATGNLQDKALRETKTGKKCVIKGARLRMYPSGFNMYRCSRGIRKPEVFRMTEAEAQQAVADLPLAWEKTISVTDAEGVVKNIVNYRQYNRACPSSQGTSY